MIKDDYLIKLIRQAANAIARALDLIALDEDPEQAEQQVDEAMRLLLKMPRDVAAQLDTPTLANMVIEPEPIRTLARAFYVDGEVRRHRGQTAGARASYKRSMELYLAVEVGDSKADVAAAKAVLQRLKELQ